MQIFYVIIKKDYLMLYEKRNDSFEKIYLGGNPEYAYSMSSAKESAEEFLKALTEEYNLESVGEIDLVVIDNEDELISEVMMKAFGKSVKERISVHKVLADIIKKLDRDKKMCISEYGINFDGKKYWLNGDQIVKERFSLLAYPLSDDMLMKYVIC